MAQRQRKPRQPLVLAFRSCRMAFLFAAVFSCIINVLMLTGPLFMMQVYDRVLTSRSVPTLVALAGVVAGIYAFVGILELVRARIMVRVGVKIDESLRDTTFERVLDHAIRKTPNVGTQPLRDLENVRQFMGSAAPFTLFDLPWAPLYLAVIWAFHPLLGLLSLAGAAVLLALAVVNEFATRAGSTTAARAAMQAHILAEEANASSEVIRAMGMQETYARRWGDHYDMALRQQSRTTDRASIFSSLSKVLRLVLQSAVLALGAWLAIRSEITPGTMIAASIIMARALAPVEQRAAKAANVHDMILRLPDGYTTRLGSEGIQLSAGQRQRVGLARALYKDPALIVLDEPNANLDSEGEAALLASIKAARERSATVVVIAHRPSALQGLNLLLCIRDGRQVAFGSKEEVPEKLRHKERPAEAAKNLAVVNG